MAGTNKLETSFTPKEKELLKPTIFADARDGYYMGSKLIEIPELYLTSEDYDRIRKAVVDDVLEAAKQDKKDAFDKALEGSKEYLKEQEFVDNPETHPMVVMAVPKPTAYVLKGENKEKQPLCDDKASDEISNILEQIGDIQAELICRHQFGDSVRPALENTSEEDLCERGIRLFYMLRNKYQGKGAILREENK